MSPVKTENRLTESHLLALIELTGTAAAAWKQHLSTWLPHATGTHHYCTRIANIRYMARSSMATVELGVNLLENTHLSWLRMDATSSYSVLVLINLSSCAHQQLVTDPELTTWRHSSAFFLSVQKHNPCLCFQLTSSLCSSIQCNCRC